MNNNNEDPDIIYGCGHSCVFRLPKVGGVATNGGCHCLPRSMPPTERVELRKKIRDLVNYCAVLRLEHKARQKLYASQPPNPNDIVLGC